MSGNEDLYAHPIPVHPSQLRWAMHNLSAAGVPIQGYSTLPNGMCVIVVMLPDSTPAPDWRTQARPKPGIELAPVLKWGLFMLVLAMFCATLYLVWGRVAGDDAQQGTQQAQQDGGGWWDWLPDVPLPWAADEPSQGATQPAPQEGWRWPWESAADGLADAAESVQDTVTIAASAVLAVLVLLIVLALVRRRR